MSAWKQSAERLELLALYKEVDALLAPYACPSSGDCCHFARTGREPYPHAVEIEEVIHAAKATSTLAPKRLKMIAANAERKCALLGDDGRCRIYASRPFGCRTYFCEKVEGPGKLPRDAVQAIARRIAELSTKAFPHRDAGPRAFSKALAR